MLAVLSVEPDAQDSVLKSQDTDRLWILTEYQHAAEVRHESSLCVVLGDVNSFHVAEFGVGATRVDKGECETLPQYLRFTSVPCVRQSLNSARCSIKGKGGTPRHD